MRKIMREVFRAYDIRGVVDVDFDEEWVVVLGQALGTYFLRHGLATAVVGHDCRHSSPVYANRIIASLAATGMDVIQLGMVATPIFYYATKHLQRPAGVMITASHNPPEYNGFKIWAGNTTLYADQIQTVHDCMAANSFPAGRGLICNHDIVPAYLEELVAQCRPLARKVKVVVDGGNGSAGLVCVELLRRIGAEVVPLFCEPDGDFPNHHPDPVVEKNIIALKAAVLATGADVGLGLDGDGDRLGVVDETGRLIYGDQLLAIYARDILNRLPQATVIGEVKCSHLLYRDIEAHGGISIMGVTGHSVMKTQIIKTGAKLAGEMSGHMFFADRYYGYDDGIYAALRLVELLGADPALPLSRRLIDWPTTYATPEIRLDCPEKVKFLVVAKVLEVFQRDYQIIDVDGVRIVFDDGWGLVRASNTQPVLVLRFEAESPERLAAIRALIEEPLAAWVRDLT
ncbi:Phosphomannomutase/phosphoglucomutase [Desulfovibrionales bacterium]